MDLRQIGYFLTVFEERSFSAAARKIGVVQPALSMQIRHLEDELGMRLFDRHSQGLVPTAAGERFYERFLPISREIAKATDDLRRHANGAGISGHIRFGCPPTFFKAILGHVLPAFAAQFPYVDLHVVEGYGGTLHEWVRNGDLDFAFGTPPRDETGLTSERVIEEQLVLVSGRPIAGESFTPCDMSAIDGLNLFIPTPRQVLGEIVRDHITNGRIRVQRTIVMDSYLGVLECARMSDWAALIPVGGILNELEGGLFIYPIRQPAMMFAWHVIRPQRLPLTDAAIAVVNLIDRQLLGIDERWRAVLDR
jgi:DNA-binding transcriptional LysR family regulator